jgi:hypothetical protein
VGGSHVYGVRYCVYRVVEYSRGGNPQARRRRAHRAWRSAASPAHVLDSRDAEGTTVEVRGEFDLVITMTDGTEFDFTHPVVAHRVANRPAVLAITGGNRSATVVDLSRVREAEVTWPNMEGSYLLGSIIGAAVGTLVFVAIAAT